MLLTPDGAMLALMDISCPPAEARAAVLAEAGYRASAGIASNKLLAKLCRWVLGCSEVARTIDC